MSNRNSEVKDPDGLSGEELQEKADIKREEIREVDPNAYDVINTGGGNPGNTVADVDEVAGDIKSLSVNEKYALILHQTKQLGPLFFVQVAPDTFDLPERDPLNLIWINILTGWHLASIILAQFEQNIVISEELEKGEESGREDAETDSNEVDVEIDSQQGVSDR